MKKRRYGAGVTALVVALAVTAVLFTRLSPEPVIGIGDSLGIALVCPITGAGEEYGSNVRAAAVMAAERVNAQGGINGKRLVLEIADSGSSSQQTVQVAQRLSAREDILCVISVETNPGAAELYREAGIPELYPVAPSDPVLRGGANSFSLSPSRAGEAAGIARQAVQEYLGCNTVAVIYHNNTEGTAVLEQFLKETEEMGLQVVAKESVAPGQSYLKPVVARLRQMQPDCVFLLADYGEIVNCIREIRLERWEVPIVVSGVSITDQTDQILGDSAEGVISSRFYALTGASKEKEDFVYRFRSYSTYYDMEQGMLVYDTVMLAAQAAEQCGEDLTRSNFRTQMGRPDAFNGLLGEVRYDGDGVAKRHTQLLEYRSGKWEVILDSPV